MKLLRARHLHDDVLYEIYLTARRGVPADPRLAEHLADCPSCERRYAELASLMDDLSTAADAEVERLFPAERRRAQLGRILDRVEHLGHPARVLSFPVRAVARRIGAARPRIATRWIAAGAAAGLFIGVGLGLILDFGRTPGQAPTINSSEPSSVSAASLPAVSFTSDADEEAFLSDLDRAFQTPRTSVLLGYDVLTPHILDVVEIR